jgi:hypothetical protein
MRTGARCAADAAGRAAAPSAPVTATPLDLTRPPAADDRRGGGRRRDSRGGERRSRRARYVVYRADSRRLTGRLHRPPATTFVDRAVPAGAYRYVVTAQDASARANESARSNAATAVVP